MSVSDNRFFIDFTGLNQMFESNKDQRREIQYVTDIIRDNRELMDSDFENTDQLLKRLDTLLLLTESRKSFWENLIQRFEKVDDEVSVILDDLIDEIKHNDL